MGTCYGVVPYVDSPNTGSVAGIVGAGGNVGAALLGLFFIKYEYNAAMEYMGWFTIGMGLLTPLVVVSLFLLFLCLVLSRFLFWWWWVKRKPTRASSSSSSNASSRSLLLCMYLY